MTSFPSFLPFFLLLPPFQESIHEAYDFVSIKPSISFSLSLSLCLPPFLPLFLFYRKKLTRARARGKSWKVMRVVLELAAMYNRRPKRDAKDRFERWRSIVVENRSVRGRGVRCGIGLPRLICSH